MKEQSLAAWWTTIKASSRERLIDPRGPLVGLRAVARDVGFEPLTEVPFEQPNDAKTLSLDPKFKNLTTDCLPCLRYKLLVGEDPNLVASWAEKLMRYCEIRRRDLKSKATRKWPDRKSAKLSMLQLTAFLLDYYHWKSDLRFLSTVLKLSDMRWIVSRKGISGALQSDDPDEFIAALFEVRVALMLQHALDHLQTDLIKQ